eukprot:1468998-Rhodomonas_salina.1
MAMKGDYSLSLSSSSPALLMASTSLSRVGALDVNEQAHRSGDETTSVSSSSPPPCSSFRETVVVTPFLNCPSKAPLHSLYKETPGLGEMGMR